MSAASRALRPRRPWLRPAAIAAAVALASFALQALARWAPGWPHRAAPAEPAESGPGGPLPFTPGAAPPRVQLAAAISDPPPKRGAWRAQARVPSQVPPKVLLKVAGTAQLDRGGLCTTIEGVAAPGAEIRVDGALVKAPGETRYRFQAPRKPGRGWVQVVTRDRSGRRRVRRVPCAAQGEEIQELTIDWHAPRSP